MSSLLIKIFATIFMIIDHIGIANGNSVLRIIGRLAFPLFAFQMAIGMKHTQNLQRHTIKLLIFATVCQIPYQIFLNLCKITPGFNIIFTFTISTLVVLTIDYFKFFKRTEEKKIEINWNILILLVLLVTLLLSLAVYVEVDYGIYGVLLPVFFYYAFGKIILTECLFPLMLIAHFYSNPSTIRLYGIVAIFDLLFILNYNGQKGYKKGRLFYLVFFLHFFFLIAYKLWLLHN